MTAVPGRGRRARRGFRFGFAILDLLVLAVGIAAARDLRFLATPRGAAEDYLRAASAGDCARMTMLVPASSPYRDRLGDSMFCRRELSRYADDAVDTPRLLTTPTGPPVVQLRLTAPGGRHREVRVALAGRQGRWRVLGIAPAG